MDRHPAAAHADDLNAYLDDTLAADDRARVTTLLDHDPALRQELAELRATAGLLNQLPEFVPRRSFRLGEEFANVAPAPPRKPILQFLPVVRTLSIAATLVFMVVAGSLFFDINGNSDSDAGTTFSAQNETMGNLGETETHAESSDETEDAPAAAAGESSMTSRGDAAAAGDAPMEDLTRLEESGDEVAPSTSNALAAPLALTDDIDRSPWIWSSVIIGALALALAGLWFGLVKGGRHASDSRS